MTSSPPNGLPRRSELRAMLRRTPAILEPGLKVRRGALELGGPDRVKFWGCDAVGRPVLLLRERGFGSAFCDDMLQLAVRWNDDPTRLSGHFARPSEPRFVVLCADVPPAVAARLRIFQTALPLRIRVLKEAHDPDAQSQLWPVLDPEFDFDALAAELGSDAGFALRRVLGAAAVLKPSLVVEGGAWPLVLRGVDGPCASIHRVEHSLHFAVSTSHGPKVWPLQSEESVDRAIDLLMRRQTGVMAGV